MRTLVAIPVYNEQRYVQQVLERVLAHAPDVLVIDDGSTDATPLLLSQCAHRNHQRRHDQRQWRR